MSEHESINSRRTRRSGSRLGGRMLACVACVGAVAVAGCGSSATSNSSGSVASNSSAASTTSGSSYASQIATSYASAPPASLIAEAKKEGELIWYDSTIPSGASAVLKAFQKQYPFIKVVKHIQLRDTDAATRVIQESAAGTQTADVIISDGVTLPELEQRGMVKAENWKSLGVPSALAPTPYGVNTAGSVTGIIYNTKLVKGSDIPTSWSDLLSPKWSGGKIGIWANPGEMVSLYASWGTSKATAYFDQLFAQKPTMYATGGVQVVQAVESGELPLGVIATSVAEPAIAAGAPIKIVVPSPAPLMALGDSVTSKGKDPAAGALFVSWLVTKAGAAAFAEANSRDNPFLPGTKSSAELKGKQIASFPLSEASEQDQDAEVLAQKMGPQ